MKRITSFRVICPRSGIIEKFHLTTVTEEGQSATIPNGCDGMDGSAHCRECVSAVCSFLLKGAEGLPSEPVNPLQLR